MRIPSANTFSFDFRCEPPAFKLQPEKPVFELKYPNGDYIRFRGWIGETSWGDDEANVPITDIELEEAGSIYDKQGAD